MIVTLEGKTMSCKLTHLKPSLIRSFKRSCEKYEKLAARIVDIGTEKADASLYRRLDYARDRMYDLAGQCHAVECAIDNAINPENAEDLPVFEDQVALPSI